MHLLIGPYSHEGIVRILINRALHNLILQNGRKLGFRVSKTPLPSLFLRSRFDKFLRQYDIQLFRQGYDVYYVRVPALENRIVLTIDTIPFSRPTDEDAVFDIQFKEGQNPANFWECNMPVDENLVGYFWVKRTTADLSATFLLKSGNFNFNYPFVITSIVSSLDYAIARAVYFHSLFLNGFENLAFSAFHAERRYEGTHGDWWANGTKVFYKRYQALLEYNLTSLDHFGIRNIWGHPIYQGLCNFFREDTTYAEDIRGEPLLRESIVDFPNTFVFHAIDGEVRFQTPFLDMYRYLGGTLNNARVGLRLDVWWLTNRIAQLNVHFWGIARYNDTLYIEELEVGKKFYISYQLYKKKKEKVVYTVQKHKKENQVSKVLHYILPIASSTSQNLHISPSSHHILTFSNISFETHIATQQSLSSDIKCEERYDMSIRKKKPIHEEKEVVVDVLHQ